jgi:hypothetical protein
MNKRRLISTGKWVAAVLPCLLFAYVTLDSFARSRMTPPSPECTIAELAEKVPPPQLLAFVDTAAGKRLCWYGEHPWWAIRSGPPCYVFDERCRLADWSLEASDSFRNVRMVVETGRGERLTLAEALDRCAKATPKR